MVLRLSKEFLTTSDKGFLAVLCLSLIQIKIGRLKIKNHNATSKLVALIFSPYSVLKPKIGCSVCTKNTNASTKANKPPI